MISTINCDSPYDTSRIENDGYQNLKTKKKVIS